MFARRKRLASKAVKVGAEDFRAGNFILHPEGDHIKVTDINGVVSHRIHRGTAKGSLLDIMLRSARDGEGDAVEHCKTYVAVMHEVLSCVPDGDFFLALHDAVQSCVDRHPEVYGIKPDISEQEDAEILDDERGFREEVETLREDADA